MNYLDVLESVATAPITVRGDIARTACPVHNGNNQSSFVFWIEDGRYFCHGCGDRGNVVDLVSKSKDMTEKEALDYLKLDSVPKSTQVRHERDKSVIDFTRENNFFLSSVNDRAMKLFDELINPEALESFDKSLLSGLIGYDSINDTLTVAIRDGYRVVQIKRRQVGDVKWMGMKDSDGAYTPHRLTGKNTVYVASGMAEYIILHASGLDYVVLQSDSSKINFDLSDKLVVVFEDNDTKQADDDVPYHLRDGVDSSLANMFKLKVTSQLKAKAIIPIDFQNILDINLKYGYDLRDFVNEYPKEWIGLITNEIKYWKREELI